MKWIDLVQFQKSKKVYCLVDCDSFYASCEILRNPKLAWKPLAVGREHDIILAANKEAKKLWIKTWTASWEAKKIRRWIKIIEPDFWYYKSISDKLFNYLRSIVNNIEVFSIDECFIDITGLDYNYKLSYPDLIHKLKLAVKKHIWIPVSIGCSNTKLLAKMFVELWKPRGIFIETEEKEIDKWLKDMKLTDIPFIASGWEKRLQYLCKTAYDFKNLNYSTVERTMGKHGLKLWFELNWVDNMKFENNEIPKSISRTFSFHPHYTNNKDLLRSYLLENFEKWYSELISNKLALKGFIIYLRRKDFYYEKGEYNFPFHIIEKELLVEKIKEIFDYIYINQKYRWTGIILTNLSSINFWQGNLFYWDKARKSKKLQKVINDLNLKFWPNILKTAWNIQANHIQKEIKLFAEIT